MEIQSIYLKTSILGHLVDAATGWNLSGPAGSMRNISKWEEVECKSEKVAEKMAECIDGGPFAGADFTPQQQMYVTEINKKYTKNVLIHSYTSFWQTEDAILNACKELYEDNENKRMTKNRLRKDPFYLKLIDTSIDSNIFYHTWRGSEGGKSFYNHADAMRGMKKPFHQGYKGQSWYSFDKNAWNNKISCYQFRDPTEEFAETFASYHAAPTMGKKKGELTPKPLLDWFLSMGLDKHVPKPDGSIGKDESK